MVIKECCEKLYANKFSDLDEMDKFLKRYNLSKLIEEEIAK